MPKEEMPVKGLVGRRITAVRWMTKKEQKDMMWYCRPVVLQLDDGTLMWPQSDDEGNDGGALMLQTGSRVKGDGFYQNRS